MKNPKRLMNNYCSIQTVLPDALSNKVLDWGYEHIPDRSLFLSQEKSGREYVPHITILYGVQNAMSIRQAIKDIQPFIVELGHISTFKNPYFNVVKIEAHSPELYELNRQLTRKVPNQPVYEGFKPHVTIAYVRQYSRLPKKLNAFVGQRWQVDKITFSDLTGNKKHFKL